MNGVLTDASTVMACSVEKLFQEAARFAGFSNYLEIGTYRYLQALRNEDKPPAYVTDYALECLSYDETSAVEGGQLNHTSAD